jgi:hypothetical protein
MRYLSIDQRAERAYRWTRWAVVAGVVWVVIGLGVMLAVGVSEARTVKTQVFQKTTLTATSKPKTWESKVLRGGAVYARVYLRGREIQQQWLGSCGAAYPDRASGLMVWLVVHNCARNAPGTYRLRYVSFRGKRRFTIRLTRKVKVGSCRACGKGVER